MAEKKEDEIMAEYLLKGGKMLEKTCRKCGCPQFEYKGATLCVVCAERESGKGPEPAGQDLRTRHQQGGSGIPAGGGGGERGGVDPALVRELAATLLVLSRRVQAEEDPDRCRRLMNAVKTGAAALRILCQI